MKRFLASLILLAIPGAAECLIHGTVLDAESGKPLPRTKVFATPHRNPVKPAIRRIAGAQGTFCFERLEPGDYDLNAEHLGYLDAAYGARPGDDKGIVLTIPAAALPALTIKMVPAASIGGIVLEPSGEPKENAGVDLLRKTWNKAWTSKQLASTATDERGMFRFPLLAPGTYYLSIDPGFTIQHAAPIPLKAGQDLASLVLTMKPPTHRHFSGRLAAGFKPLPQRERDPVLYVRPERGPSSEIAVGKDGTFSADDLLPAKYFIQVQGVMDGILTHVDLTEGDLYGFTIEPVRGYEVRISFRVEGNVPPQKVNLQMREVDTGYERFTSAEPDGTFLFRNVQPGIYRIEADTAGLYVKKPATLDLRKPQSGPIEAILSTGVARIDGRLDLPEGAMPSLAATVVWMDEAKSRTEVSGDSTDVDSTGKFELPRLAPGKYRLFAIEGFDDSLWGSLELAAALREKSVSVELHESETRPIALPVISFEEWTAALRKAGI